MGDVHRHPHEWTDEERELLAPLIDATIMRVDGDPLETIARPIVESLWSEVRPLIVETIREQAESSALVAHSLAEALIDLDLGPRESRLALAVIQQAGVDLAAHEFFLDCCLACIGDGLERAAPAR